MTSSNDPDRLHKVYMSINTSSDGPDPGLNNLLELSCVLHYENGDIIDEINIKLKKINGRKSDKITMQNFWNIHTEAWNWVNTDNVDVDEGMTKFYNFFNEYSKKFSIRFVGDPASRDFVWLQEYYTNYVPFDITKLYPYCRCLTTMRKSYQKMSGLSEDEILKLKHELQNGEETTHIGIERARRQAQEFCKLRQLMYSFKNINLYNINNIFSSIETIDKNINYIKDNISINLKNIQISNTLINQNISNILSGVKPMIELQTNKIIEYINSNVILIKKSNTTKILENLIY